MAKSYKSTQEDGTVKATGRAKDHQLPIAGAIEKCDSKVSPFLLALTIMDFFTAFHTNVRGITNDRLPIDFELVKVMQCQAIQTLT